jgi:hypothetical protein
MNTQAIHFVQGENMPSSKKGQTGKTKRTSKKTSKKIAALDQAVILDNVAGGAWPHETFTKGSPAWGKVGWEPLPGGFTKSGGFGKRGF